MVNCSWQNKEDYGSRYDVGVFCPDQPSLNRDRAVPRVGWLRYRPWSWSTADRHVAEDPQSGIVGTDSGRPVCAIDKVVAEVWPGGVYHPSKGTATALYLLRDTEITRVVMIGADQVLAKSPSCGQHHPPALDAAHSAGEVNRHQWAVEHDVLVATADRLNKGVMFDA
jgi:hypothetical protein